MGELECTHPQDQAWEEAAGNAVCGHQEELSLVPSVLGVWAGTECFRVKGQLAGKRTGSWDNDWVIQRDLPGEWLRKPGAFFVISPSGLFERAKFVKVNLCWQSQIQMSRLRSSLSPEHEKWTTQWPYYQSPEFKLFSIRDF